MPIIDYPCAQCGTVFKARTDKLNKGIGAYCNKACRGLAERTRFKSICERCGTEFFTIPSRTKVGWGRHCSAKCANETVAIANTTHGNTIGAFKSKAYRVWQDMKARCLIESHPSFHHYGGRGIAICDRWLSFDNFLSDMGEPGKGMSIDRIDNNGNYEPDNCRWATPTQQGNNKRDNRVVSYLGRQMTLTEAAREAGISPQTVTARIRYGWPEHRLFDPPMWTRRDVSRRVSS